MGSLWFYEDLVQERQAATWQLLEEWGKEIQREEIRQVLSELYGSRPGGSLFDMRALSES